MKALIITLLTISTTSLAGLKTQTLEEPVITIHDQENAQIEACGFDTKNKQRCELLKGFFLLDGDFEGSYSYQILEVDSAGVYSRLANFAQLNTNGTLKINEDLTCDLEWYSYRYTLEERVTALSLGVLVRNRDDLQIKCERKN